MYKQTIEHIKVIVIPLDGTVFDLNKYRYNYYRHLCDNKNITFTKEEFYPHLGNMYEMYKNLPLIKEKDVSSFNERVERELFDYLKHKGIKPKEGFIELIEYLHQKNIQIAILSTHTTQAAVDYLKLVDLYNKVHFIIGSDTSSAPLPSSQMLETIRDFFKVENHEVLIISSFMALNQAANQLNMNVIYCEDLVPAGQPEKETSYKTVHYLFEVLDTLLFDQYDDATLYSTILGMTPNMSKDELDQVHNKLHETYQDDEQIIDLIDQTYEYHLSMLGQQTIKDASVSLKKPIKRFTFDDELIETPPQNNSETPIINEEKIPVEKQNLEKIHIHPLDETEEKELTTLLQQINKTSKSDLSQNADIQSTEIKNDNETQPEPINIQQLINDDEEEQKETKKRKPILSFFINIIYIFSISFLILFIGILISVLFIHQFEQNTGIFSSISQAFYIYNNMINSIFETIINFLHSFINSVPTYDQYLHNNAFFSYEGIQLCHIFIFQSLVIGIIRLIIYFIKRTSENEIIDEEN